MKKHIVVFGISLLSYEAWAQFAVSNNFTAGTIISASQMNANFDEVEAQINALWAPGSISANQLAPMGATANQVLMFNGAVWSPATISDNTKLPLVGGTLSGNINMNSNKITNLSSPSANGDAATKSYVDTMLTNLNASNITTGTLSPARGGTGTTSLSANSFVITNGTGTSMINLTCSPGTKVGFYGPTPGCLPQDWAEGVNGIEYNNTSNVSIGASASATDKLYVLADGTKNGIIVNSSAPSSTKLLGLYHQSNPRFIVKHDGNVGLGTDIPTYPLHVEKNSPAMQPYLYLKNTIASPAPGHGNAIKFQVGNATAHIEGRYESTGSANLSFHTSESAILSQKMVITSGGTVGIGTASPNPSHKLVVNGIIAPAGNYSLGDSGAVFSEVYATDGTINTSDRRAKKEIKETDLGLDFINHLRPVSYRWKKGKNTDVHYGLIAQEVEAVLKEFTEKGREASIVNHDKKTDKYGIRYTELISPLIKAVQELHAENDAMKAYLCAKDPDAPFCKE